MNAFDFHRKRVVVTGGSRGIGRAIARAFAAAGADVSICARGRAALEATCAEIAGFGHKAHATVCDLTDGTAVTQYVGEAVAALGGLDVLVNNASGFGMTDDEDGWTASFNVDIMAIVRASHAALPFLRKAEGGSIVNIASIAGMRASTRSAPYAATKAAVINYTSSQAATLAEHRIRVNAISPGSIEFPGGLWERRKADNPELYERTLASIPFDRFGTAEEIADLKGLNRRSPWYAFVMLLLMFSLAGIPPTVGFYAKLVVLQSLLGDSLQGPMVWLAIIAVMFSLVGAFYYLRVVKVMYFDEPLAGSAVPIAATTDMRVALSVNGVLVLVLGILPQYLLNLCTDAMMRTLGG